MDASAINVAILIDSWFPGKKRIGSVGGNQIHVKTLTERLSRRHLVHFSLFFPAYDNIVYKLFWPLIAFVRLVELHRRQPFDLLHAHGPISAMVVFIAGKILKLPTIQTIHGTHLMDLKTKTLGSWIQRQIFTNTPFTALISVSHSFLKYPNINNTIHIIPNGVDVHEFDAVTVDKYPDPTIIWVGKNDPSKGITVLRQAIAKIRKKMPNLQAKLITGGALTGKALIRAYKRSHVFVLPSLAESQSIALLEAWAAKLPVVATSVGDNPSIVKNGVNGYLVEPGNVTQLAEAIHKILRARNKNIKMGEAGYNLVKQTYSWDKTAATTWQVYRQVIKLHTHKP